MKQERHVRKETISILIISNTGKDYKKFHISKLGYKLILYIPALLCAVIVLMIGLFIFSQREQSALRAKIASSEQIVSQLETENKNISAEKAKLAEENEQLRSEEEVSTETETEAEAAPEPYPGAPGGYPYLGTGGKLVSSFSEEQPYMSINTHTGGQIVAASDGTVASVSSTDSYPLIVELKHENGYTTRYLCSKEAETQLQENAQVKTGDVLFDIVVDDTQFDYQILLNNEPIDPLMVIEAKG